MLHPSLLMFMLITILSVFITISLPFWVIIWIGLEVNMMCFIPVILSPGGKYAAEAALKYFLTQVLASLLIIIAVVNPIYFSIPSEYLVSLALLLKMGAAPVHQWMPSIVDGLSWSAVFLLLSIQKVNPFVLLSLTANISFEYLFFFIFVFMCSLVGSFGGLSQSSLRKIFVFSSISHMGWMLAAIGLMNNLWFSYLLMYIFILMVAIKPLSKYQMFSLTKLLIFNKWKISLLSAFSFMSLGGLPPFSGFVPKFIVMQEMLDNDEIVLFILLVGTLVSLFFYCRVFVFNLYFFSKMKQIQIKMKEINIFEMILNGLGLFLLSGCFIIFLNFKLMKLKTFKVFNKLCLSLINKVPDKSIVLMRQMCIVLLLMTAYATLNLQFNMIFSLYY